MTQEMKLLQAAKDGNTAAFEQIVNKYQSLVCAITFSGTGRVDISEELAQETFLSAWKNLQQLTKPSGFRPWLCTIARNMLNSYYRKKKTVPLDPANLAEMTDPAPTPSETLIAQEEHLMLQQALMQIPAKYRDPLVMYYRQEKSTRQVAVGLELKESTVRMRLHRARKMLREEIAARLERTLQRTAPGKTFTKAVMVAVGGAAIGMSASASVASANAAGTGASTGVTAVMSTVTAKIITAAAVAAIAAGAVFAYKHLSQPEQPPVQSAAVAVVPIEQEPVVTPESLKPDPQEVAANPIETPKTKIAAMSTNLDVENALNTEPASIALTTEVPENTEYVFEPNGVLSGLITDTETGEPVTDAEVQLSLSRTYTTKTDENGYYSFKKIDKDGNYRLAIHSVKHVGITAYKKLPMIHLEKEGQEVRHFKLNKACMLDVWVVDEEGRPLKDAGIYATSLADDNPREIGNKMNFRETDENGYMLLGGFPPSDSPYLITAVHNRKKTISEKNGIRRVESTPNYAYAGQQVILNDPDTILSTEIVLKKGTSVKGYAEYLDGVPAEGLGICAYPDWWHSNSCPKAWPIDPNGFFIIDQIVPGTYNLQINIPTGEGSSMGKHLFSTHLPLQEGELLKVTVPEKSPKSLVSICGTVKFTGDKKPNNVRIQAYSKEHGHQTTHLDRSMRGELKTSFCLDRLEPGTYRVQFEGSEIESVTMENVQAPCDDIEVELVAVGKPRLIGIVMDVETTKPIENFKVRVKKLGTYRGPNYSQNNQWTDFRSEKGTFEIEAVGPGLYQVQVTSEGYAAQWSSEIDTDNNAAVLMKLNKGGAITGAVKDSKGQPVQNAMVIPLSVAGGTSGRGKDIFVSTDGSTQTDSKGIFTLSCLAEGNETLKVTHPDYADEIVQDIPVQTNQITESKPILLGKGAAIEGYVFDADGKPESSVTLYVQDASGYGGTNDEQAGRLGVAITDPNGFYRVENLPEKMCYLKRQNEWSALGVTRRTVMPQNGKTSRIDFGGKAELSGQVILEGQPLSSTRIQLGPGGKPHFGSFRAFAVTDTNGNFSFYPGIAGSYSIYYKPAQSRDWNELAGVILSPDKDVDLGVIPEQTSMLRIYVTQPLDSPQWEITYLTVQKGVNQFGRPATTVKSPSTPEEAYLATNLVAGKYRVIMSRPDNLMYQVPVEIKEGEIESDLIIDLPTSNSGLNVIAAQDVPFLKAYTEDEGVIITMSPSEDGTFHADNVPAGRYNLTNGMFLDKQFILTSFDLLPEETKTVDISQSAPDPVSISALLVEIVDENGSPISGCNIWLEGDNGKIDPMMQDDFQTTFITSAGNYTIHTIRAGCEDANKPVTLEAIDMTSGNRSKMEPKKLLLRLVPDGNGGR